MSPDTEQAVATGCFGCGPILAVVAFWCVVGYAIVHFALKWW